MQLVDSDVIIIAIMAIGIGVDDTIHFLMRFHFELGKTDNVDKALDETFHYSGRATTFSRIYAISENPGS